MKNNKHYFLSYENKAFGLNLKDKEYVICIFNSKTLISKFATAKRLPSYDVMEIRDLEEFLKQLPVRAIYITRIIKTRIVYEILNVINN